MLVHKVKRTAVAVLVGGSFAIGATTLARQFASAPADLPGRVEIEHQSPESAEAAPEDASAAPRVSLDEVKAALKRRREGIKKPLSSATRRRGCRWSPGPRLSLGHHANADEDGRA